MPQHRERVYIVGRLLSRCLSPFKFPTPLPPVSIESFLDPIAPVLQHGVSHYEKLGPMARSNFEEMLCDLESRGLDPDHQHFVLDIDASQRFRSYMLDRSHCLLKSRPRGYYMSSRKRRITAAEIFKLQGFAPLPTGAVSRCAIGGMLGNAMSLNVVVRLLSLALPSVGLIVARDFVDPWV